jgi:hypothetical protein
MAAKIVTGQVHIIVAPSSTQNYHSVTHADSGREVVRCETFAEAQREQARLNKLG